MQKPNCVSIIIQKHIPGFVKSIRFRGMDISPVGIGTAAWGGGINGGGQMYGSSISANELSYIFRQASAQGIDLFDTSPAFGTSETALGYASRTNRSVKFSTKFIPSGFQTKKAMRRSAMNSMEALGTNVLDFYGVQTPADVNKWTSELIPLLDEGLVKNVGVSNHNLNQIIQAQEVLEKAGHSLAYVQNHYSIISHEERDEGIIDWCRENNALFFAYMVLEQGALSGKYDTKHPMPAGSARAETYNPVLDKLEILNAELKKLAEKYGVGPAQIPVAWAIAKGTLPIIGVTKENQVLDAVKAANVTLTADETAELEKVADSLELNVIRMWEKEMK